MKFKYIFFIFIFIGLAIVAGYTATYTVTAQNPFDIEFPISELGNCESFDECGVYCDEPENVPACFAWAEAQGIEVGEPGEHLDVPPEGGPGGCTSEGECITYCDTPSNFDECINFARDKGHISDDEVDKALRGGPGGCQNYDECEIYCSEPANQLECIEDAVAEGYMTPEEAVQISRFLDGDVVGPIGHRGPYIDGPEIDIDIEKARRVINELGGGPGGCQDFAECDTFCGDQANDEVCFNFAIEYELIAPEKADMFERIREEGGPGGCNGLECETYCEEPGNELECLAFAEENGFIDRNEAEQARRFLSATEEGGPGGCQGRECEIYCDDQTNRDECFDFAKSSGFLPPEEIERIENLQRIGQKVEDEGGPGDCRSEADCMVYCGDTANFDECAAFAVNEGFLSPEEAELELRRFIGVEQFGPAGFGHGFGGPPGSDGFGGPGDHGLDGFGGPDDFDSGGHGPGFGDIPPEFKDQFESEFRSRFGDFESFRDQFEHGGPVPSGGFQPPTDFPGRDQFPGGAGSGDSHVTLTRNPSGTFTLIIRDQDGIQDFFFKPQDGSHYSGGLNCDKEYKTETSVFGQMKFPLDSYVVDCSGNKFEFAIPSLDDFDSRRPSVNGVPSPGEPPFPVGDEFTGEFPFPRDDFSDDLQPPDGFEKPFPGDFPISDDSRVSPDAEFPRYDEFPEDFSFPENSQFPPDGFEGDLYFEDFREEYVPGIEEFSRDFLPPDEFPSDSFPSDWVLHQDEPQGYPESIDGVPQEIIDTPTVNFDVIPQEPSFSPETYPEFIPPTDFNYDESVPPSTFIPEIPDGYELPPDENLLYLLPRGSLLANMIELFGAMRVGR